MLPTPVLESGETLSHAVVELAGSTETCQEGEPVLNARVTLMPAFWVLSGTVRVMPVLDAVKLGGSPGTAAWYCTVALAEALRPVVAVPVMVNVLLEPQHIVP